VKFPVRMTLSEMVAELDERVRSGSNDDAARWMRICADVLDARPEPVGGTAVLDASET
jgi:hypothetical protein